MATATLARPPTQAPTQTCESPQSRLAALNGYICDAVRHCGDRDRGVLAFEDMVQEATVAVWEVLKEEPNANIGFIWTVAYHAAIHALRRGKSVNRPITLGPVKYQVVSLEGLMEDKDGWNIIEEALARRKHRGKVSNPTEEIAIPCIMLQELWGCLTPRQQQVLELRLQAKCHRFLAGVLSPIPPASPAWPTRWGGRLRPANSGRVG